MRIAEHDEVMECYLMTGDSDYLIRVAVADMAAVAMVLPALMPVAWLAWAVVASLVVSSYAFCIALPVAAFTGQRGLSKGHGLGSLAYIGNIVGAGTSLISAFGLLVAAFLALRS